MRLYKNKWNKKNINNHRVKEIASNTELSFSACEVLSTMNLSDKEIDRFLQPSLSSDLANTNEALEVLKKHVASKANIVIFGDYDVDGITASSLLYNFFKDNGVKTEVIIPNRYTHGYGLNEKSLDLITSDTDLVITVDCGITSVNEVDTLMKQGIDVIVTDHHELKEKLPSTVCINPKIGGGYLYLAGAGVALKFALSIAQCFDFKFNEDLYILAMLGTIADVMPIQDENRFLVVKGLERIKGSSFKGLNTLIETLKLTSIDESDIGFKIAPIINAAGRLGEEKRALDLFVEFQDTTLVNYLIRLNDKRKIEEKRIVDEVLKEDFSDKKIVVAKSKKWKKGVLGVAASRISIALRKPCILLSEEQTLSGSCRSYGDFDMLDVLNNNKKNIIRYGGHKQAAGLEVDLNNYSLFKENVEKYAEEKFNKESCYKTYEYFDVSIDNLNSQLVHELNKLRPYGVGNEKPVFRLLGLKLANIKIYGKNNNFYVLDFEKNGMHLKGIYFKKNNFEYFKIDYKYDIIFSLDINTFNGHENLQLEIVDYRAINKYCISHNPFLLSYYIDLVHSFSNYSKTNASIEFIDYENLIKYGGIKKEEFDYSSHRLPKSLPSIFLWKDFKYDLDKVEKNIMLNIPDDSTLRKSYKYFQSNPFIDLKRVNNYLGLLLALTIFSELNLIRYDIKEESIMIEFNDNKNSVLLKNSNTYNKMNKLMEDWNGFKKHN